jgi:hypothetical protein
LAACPTHGRTSVRMDDEQLLSFKIMLDDQMCDRGQIDSL